MSKSGWQSWGLRAGIVLIAVLAAFPHVWYRDAFQLELELFELIPGARLGNVAMNGLIASSVIAIAALFVTCARACLGAWPPGWSAVLLYGMSLVTLLLNAPVMMYLHRMRVWIEFVYRGYSGAP